MRALYGASKPVTATLCLVCAQLNTLNRDKGKNTTQTAAYLPIYLVETQEVREDVYRRPAAVSFLSRS